MRWVIVSPLAKRVGCNNVCSSDRCACAPYFSFHRSIKTKVPSMRKSSSQLITALAISPVGMQVDEI